MGGHRTYLLGRIGVNANIHIVIVYKMSWMNTALNDGPWT